MLFNSQVFILLFLPAVVAGFYLLRKYLSVRVSTAFLVLASLFFYGWWNEQYVFLILISILVNFSFGLLLVKRLNSKHKKRIILAIGVLFNVGLLGYFKYANFFVDNLNALTGTDIHLAPIVLPLAISFFTFQQIAYLVDAYKGEMKEYSFLHYCLFVTFFPQLIAGPIVHHKEMMPQFDNWKSSIASKMLSGGVFIFLVGLFKKVVIADFFAEYATNGFDVAESLTVLDAWVTSLSYTFQLYFDFSGYTDMAIGAAMMFGINLPQNFNSPYKALSIQDFWRRWHITLSRFLRDYIYIPLGGSKVKEYRVLTNIMITFIIGGIWHGAAWTFAVWGILHGLALVIFKQWQKFNIIMPKVLAWFITFNFINITWVFFRATSFEDAFKVLRGMFGIDNEWHALGTGITYMQLFLWASLFVALIWVAVAKNSGYYKEKFEPTIVYLVLSLILACTAFICMGDYSEFLYFQF